MIIRCRPVPGLSVLTTGSASTASSSPARNEPATEDRQLRGSQTGWGERAART